MTSYNYAAFVEAAVSSARSQLADGDELLVVDDASTDGSRRILQRLLGGRLIEHDSNEGLCAARNTALLAATTDWLVYLDADDVLLPGYLEEVRRRARLCSSRVGVIYGPAAYFGTRKGFSRVAPFSQGHLRSWNVLHSTALLRREAVIALGGYDTSFREVGHEDWDLYLRMAKAGWSGSVVPGAIFGYRQHGPTRTARALRRTDELHALLAAKHPWRLTVPPPNLGDRLVLKAQRELTYARQRRTRSGRLPDIAAALAEYD